MNVRRLRAVSASLLVLTQVVAPTLLPMAASAGSLFGAYFETRYSYSTGNTWYPVVGDVDLDGRDDVVSIRTDETTFATLLVRFGEPDGGPAGVPLQLTLPTAMWFDSWPCIDDIDGDGIPDVVIGAQSSLVVCRGLGGRAFAPPVVLPEPSYGYVPAGDLNGDAIPDYACVDNPGSAPDSVRIRFGNGNLAFAPGPAFRIQDGASNGVHLRDFNADGLLDVFVGADTTSTLLLNLGGGNFAPFDVAATRPFPAGDLDGNGFEDLVSDQGVLLNNGDGTFQASIPHGMGFPYPQCTVDLDEDGRLDLVGVIVVSGVRYVRVMRGRGDGTFDPEVLHRTCYASEVLSHGDFDQDGHQDLVLLRWDTYDEAYMFGKGNGGFRQLARTFPSGVSGPLAVGNLGPEPYPDIVIRGGATVAVLTADGPASYAAPVTYAALGTMSSLAVGDLNGDGRDDVVAGYSSNPVLSVWLTQPGGALGSRVDTPIASGTQVLRLADLDGNGTLDLISRVVVSYFEDPNGTWRPGNGDGTFGAANWLPGHLGGEFEAVDLDRNGALDIVTGSGFPTPVPPDGLAFRVVLASSPGVFPTFVDYPGSTGSFTGTGSFDADSLADVVVDADSVWVYPGIGSGVLGARRSLGRGGSWLKGVGDLDGDGLTDLLGFRSLSYSVGVRLGSGGAAAPEAGYGPQRHAPLLSARYVLADVDGNGAQDAIVGDAPGNLVTLLLNLTNTPTVGVPPPASRPATRLAVRAGPNPAISRVSLALDLDGTTPVEVQLFDLSGRRLASESIARPAGRHVTLALGGTERLAPGLYLVRVRQGGEAATARVCVVR